MRVHLRRRTSTDTASITITPVNDAPILDAGASPTLSAVAEDSANPPGDTVAAIVVDGSITEIPLDTAAVEAIAVIGVDNTNGAWQYSTNGGNTWTAFGTPTVAAARLLGPTNLIRFTPNANYNGTATFTFRAWDMTTGTAGAVADTTSNGGTSAFSTTTDSASISITPVNDAPLLNGGASPTLSDAFEDNVNQAGDTVAAIIVDGSITEIPLHNAPVEAIAVTGVDNSNGLWQYSPNGGIWTAFGASTAAAARLLSPTHLIRFLPNANFNGPATFDFRAWDMTAGTVGSTANTTVSGGTTAFSGTVDTASITVTPVNDAPSFTKGADQIVPKNSPTQTVNGWATAISPDQGLPAHPSEAGQALDFIVTNNNAALFAVAPAIDASGNLTYTPATNASGTAQIAAGLRH